MYSPLQKPRKNYQRCKPCGKVCYYELQVRRWDNDLHSWETLEKRRKDNQLILLYKGLKVRCMPLFPRLDVALDVAEINTLWHFRFPLLVLKSKDIVSSQRLSVFWNDLSDSLLLLNLSRTQPFLVGSSSYLQVTRTSITSRKSSKFGQIRPRTAELAALERLEKSP